MWKIKILILLFSLQVSVNALGILYPKASPSRFVVPLDGLWKFTFAANGSFDNNESFLGNPNNKDIHWMPVPSSYNDILTSVEGRDYLGPVKYERTFHVPRDWGTTDRYWLRFDSVSYSADVYLNGEFVVSHGISHLPFVHEINNYLQFGDNVLTVIVDNTLSESTIPQGFMQELPTGKQKQSYKFDFFKYAGIDRPVTLYKTPKVFIDDITTNSSYFGTTGMLFFDVSINGTFENTYQVVYTATILDRDNKPVAQEQTTKNYLEHFVSTLPILEVKLWWPFGMHDDPGYLYTLRVEIDAVSAELTHVYDQYELKFGIRNLEWDQTNVKINGQPIYIKGAGRHEDSDVRGKGFDYPLIIREHNLMRWLGLNCYRTSHYPYAEQTMDLADSLGIMVINEGLAVSLDSYNDELLENHKLSLTELYQRDKNRPSTIMWSIANEPNTMLEDAVNYFKEVAFHMKSLDPNRPITLTNFPDIEISVNVFQFLDVVSVNRYEGWYNENGNISAITEKVVSILTAWHETYNKPILLTEYGADATVELRSLPEYPWSSVYQNSVLEKNFEAFDILRQKGWFLGEMIWNFADFMTAEVMYRPGGNKKGMFTRQRQPKEGAYLLRNRYVSLT